MKGLKKSKTVKKIGRENQCKNEENRCINYIQNENNKKEKSRENCGMRHLMYNNLTEKRRISETK